MTPRIASLAVVTIALLSCAGNGATGTTASAWISPPYGSAHFTLHYQSLDAATIAQTAAAMEAEYPRVVAGLGGNAPPHVNVWLYADHAALESALAPLIGTLPAWSSGAAPRRDQIHLMSPNHPQYQPYTQMIANLVHEFAHCVSLQRNSSIANNPRWFWESVAIYEAGQQRDPRTLSYMTALTPPSFATLNSIDNTRVYEVGYTIAEFIVARWGEPALASLIDNNADLATLGVTQAQLEADWFAWVRAKYRF